ncbi:MAG TPA: hypothetical protein VGB94_02435 [Acidobacteriaceae bacterium]
MRHVIGMRRVAAAVLLVVAGSGAGAMAWTTKSASKLPPVETMCASASFEGVAQAGQSYTQPLGNGMAFTLEAVRAGWIVRVLPVKGPRPAHDAAELATPPYNSVTPLAVTTDFSFRAQDAVAWNPRRFQFAANAADMVRLQRAYTAYLAAPDNAALGEKLAELAAGSATAELQILDAKLIPGTANQAQMAAAVASHFSQTPHTTEPSGASPLGAVTWMRFRVTLHLPREFEAATGLAVDRRGCGK